MMFNEHMPHTNTTENTFAKTCSTGKLHFFDSAIVCGSTKRAVAVSPEAAEATPLAQQCTKCFGKDGGGVARSMESVG
jgi:hypothetical protein